MKDFIKKLQKDLKTLENAVKKDSDELLKKVKSYATKENITAAGVEIEKVLEKKLKELRLISLLLVLQLVTRIN